MKEKPEMLRYLSKNTKTGDFNLQRTLPGSFFIIPQRLPSIRTVVLAFTVNKQTNIFNYIYKLFSASAGHTHALVALNTSLTML